MEAELGQGLLNERLLLRFAGRSPFCLHAAGCNKSGRRHDRLSSLGFGWFAPFNHPDEAAAIQNQAHRLNQSPHLFWSLAELAFSERSSFGQHFEIVRRNGRRCQVAENL